MSAISVTPETSQLSRGWLKALAPANMRDMSVTCDTFQDDVSPLKEVEANMLDMSVTLETSQLSRGWLKGPFSTNMLDMSVTLETSQLSRGWLNFPAPANMPDMSVTLETSQDDMVSLKDERANMPDMSVTPDKSGVSAALILTLPVFLNASAMLLHSMVPHCSIDSSFPALPLPPAINLSKSPDMRTVCVPELAYLCTWLPVTFSDTMPSPQSTVYLADEPPTFIVMVSLATVVVQVVTKSSVLSDRWGAAKICGLTSDSAVIVILAMLYGA